tara:strand:- start:864 stop:1205 length:342 start_codon:yes stop_codon:yes gene_type:complete
MSNVLKNAQEHFKNKLSGGLNKMTVQEWKTDVYYKPAYSFAVESKIIELQQQGKTVEALVESVINKALNPEGKPMFNRMDKLTLMNEVDPQVLLRIATVLNSATADYETVVKN